VRGGRKKTLQGRALREKFKEETRAKIRVKRHMTACAPTCPKVKRQKRRERGIIGKPAEKTPKRLCLRLESA